MRRLFLGLLTLLLNYAIAKPVIFDLTIEAIKIHECDSINNLRSPKIIIPIGSVGGVTNFMGSPNGELLLCEDEASHIIIYGSSDLSELQRLEFEGKSIKGSTFLNDTTVIFISDDTTLVYWDLYTNKIKIFRSTKRLLKLIVFEKDIYSIDLGKQLYLLSINGGNCQFSKQTDFVMDEIRFKSNFEYVIIKDSIVATVNSKTGLIKKKILNNKITAFDINNNGDILLGFDNGHILEFDFQLELSRTLSPSSYMVSTLKYVDDSLVLSGSYDFTLTLQNTRSVLDVVYLNEWIVGSVKSKNSFFVATWDGRINSFRVDKSLNYVRSAIYQLKKATAFVQKKDKTYISYNDGEIHEYDSNLNRSSQIINVLNEAVLNFDVSDDLTKLVAFSHKGLRMISLNPTSTNFSWFGDDLQSVKFIPNSLDFLFNTASYCYKYSEGILDSINLKDGWFIKKVFDTAILVAGFDKVLIFGSHSLKQIETDVDEWIILCDLISKDRKLISSAVEGITIYNKTGKIQRKINVNGSIIGVEKIDKNHLLLLDESGFLLSLDLRKKKTEVLRSFEKYSSYDFLLDSKTGTIVLPFCDSNQRNSKIEILNSAGKRLNNIDDVGGYVICAANSYNSINYNLNDSNTILFLTTDGTLKSWDIRKNGLDPLTRLGLDNCSWLNSKFKGIDLGNVYLNHGLLKIPIRNDTLTLLKMKNDDWLIYDRFYRFDGTKGAIEKIYFTCGLKPFYLSQIKDSLFIPNLLRRYWNGEDLQHLPTLIGMSGCDDLPVVSKVDDCQYYLKCGHDEITSVEVYVDGILRLEYDQSDLVIDKDGYILNLDQRQIGSYILEGEKPDIDVVAKSTNGISTMRGVNIQVPLRVPANRKPAIHAVMIGVDAYKDEKMNLQFASKDANDLQRVLNAAACEFFNIDSLERVFFYNLTIDLNGSIGSEGIKGLTPDRRNIFNVLQVIKNISKPEDVFLFFFAGHGEIIGEKELLLLTTEAKSDNLVGLRITELLKEMKEIPAGKRILILDACHSGVAINNLGLSFYAGSRDVQNSIFESRRIKELDLLASKSGFAILTASSSSQKALELPQFEHGLLTYALLSSLASNKEILNDKNQIVLDKWFISAEEKIQQINSRQSAEKMVPTSFPLGVMNDSIKSLIHLPRTPAIQIMDAVNLSQFENNKYPWDDSDLKNRLTIAMNSMQLNGLTKFTLTTEDMPCGHEIYSRYQVHNGLISINFTVHKNGKVILTENVKCEISQLDLSLIDFSKKLLKIVNSDDI